MSTTWTDSSRLLFRCKLSAKRMSISFFFYVHVTVHCNKFLFNKIQPDALFYKFLFLFFGLALYMFLAVLLPIIRSSRAVHSALVHVIQVLETAFKQSRDGTAFQSRLCLKAVSKTCMTYQCRMHSCWTPDDGQRNCLKHVERQAKK
jgi:hypothetical protein